MRLRFFAITLTLVAAATASASERSGSYVGVARCELVRPAYEGSPLRPVSIQVYSDVSSPARGWLALDGYHADGQLERFGFDARLRFGNAGIEVTLKSAAEHLLSIRRGTRQSLEFSFYFLPKKDQYLCDSR